MVNLILQHHGQQPHVKCCAPASQLSAGHLPWTAIIQAPIMGHLVEDHITSPARHAYPSGQRRVSLWVA